GGKKKQGLGGKVVGEGQLANINVGTGAEVIAARKAALERAQASVVLAQKTYDRVSQLAEHGNAPQARLDQATDTLHENQRAVDQAKSAYEQAVNGYTNEEREIAVANVQKAVADIEAVQSIVDQMVVYAPVASQVYTQRGARRIHLAWGAAGAPDRSQRPVGPLRPARRSGQDAQTRRPLRRAHSGT